MPAPATTRLGPFSVDTEGRLTPWLDGETPAFTFKWRDRTIQASMTATGPEAGQLGFQTTVGRIPSSANGRPGDRLDGFAALRAMRNALPPGWRVRLAPDHRAVVESKAQITLPVTATALVTACTLFLIALDPLLAVLPEARP